MLVLYSSGLLEEFRTYYVWVCGESEISLTLSLKDINGTSTNVKNAGNIANSLT